MVRLGLELDLKEKEERREEKKIRKIRVMAMPPRTIHSQAVAPKTCLRPYLT